MLSLCFSVIKRTIAVMGLSVINPGMLVHYCNRMRSEGSYMENIHVILTQLMSAQVDTMIVQAIGLLDDLDKELNTYAMRVREWYGWHFPEMTRVVTDNLQYAKTVRPPRPAAHASASVTPSAGMQPRRTSPGCRDSCPHARTEAYPWI